MNKFENRSIDFSFQFFERFQISGDLLAVTPVNSNIQNHPLVHIDLLIHRVAVWSEFTLQMTMRSSGWQTFGSGKRTRTGIRTQNV